MGNTIMLSRSIGHNKLNLDADVMAALLPWLDGVDPQAFLFSNDAGGTPLPAQVVSAQLRYCAIDILGHAVTWRAVRNASLRFQLRLGISVQALAKQCGMGAKSLLRVAGLQISHREYGLTRDYGTPILSRWPLFTDVYQTMRSANEPFDGVRDRAILSLLFFAFATPQMISTMDRNDFVDETYCLNRKHGWVMYGSQDRVVASLAAWISARGEYPGPLFVFRGEQAACHMTTEQIESMVQQRSRRQRRCLTAHTVRMAGISRAADAGLPLAVLADASDLTYEQLAGVLNLHQSAETVERVRLQIDALLEARATPARLEQICDGQLGQDYVHSGTP